MLPYLTPKPKAMETPNMACNRSSHPLENFLYEALRTDYESGKLFGVKKTEIQH